MQKMTPASSVIVAILLSFGLVYGQYLPDWSSLDTRPIPQWYDQAKFGIFIHWGVFSVPSTSSEWFWYQWKFNHKLHVVKFMKDNYPPDFIYADFAEQFQIEFFNPDEWADILASSGAKYVVLTSKHHEGYTLWPSKYSWNWNANDVGPGMDLVGALADSIRNRTSLRFGLYHSLYEWFHPIYLDDKVHRFANRTFPTYKTIPELYEIVNTYKPDVVWSDGDWEAPDTYWGSTDFIAWLYNESPVKDTVVTNDRWGKDIICTHGDFYTCSDNYNPGVLQPHKWENCMTIDKSCWGYRRDAKLEDYRTIKELISALVTTISCGGNLLLNVGPTAYGRIVPIFEERLRQIGQWLSVNGEAVYDSQPWTYQNDTITPNVWYTTNAGNGAVYVFVLDWPSNYVLTLGAPITTGQTVATLLGSTTLEWQPTGAEGMTITLPYLLPNQLPWAWVIKLLGVQ